MNVAMSSKKRASVACILLFLSATSLVTSAPLELDPRDPENGCIALCGCCPCPCRDPDPPAETAPPSPTSTPLPPPSTSVPEPSPTSTVAPGSQGEPSDFKSDEQPYRVVSPDADPNAQNYLGTWLYGYNGCKQKNSAYKGNIDEAYYDSWTIANTDGVKENIDWNEAASLEYLGAPGANQPKQSQIQAVLANIATVIYSYKNPLFQHYIHVRCDDPLMKCEKRPDKDPCNPKPPPLGIKPKETPVAYATNDGGDKYPLINFCNGFFERRSLSNAIAYGAAQGGLEKYKLSNYVNRASTFFHELTHLDLAADSPSPNPAITDLTVAIKLGNTGKSFEAHAYGALFTKILARYAGDVGYYVQRNADNFAMYALAIYVMTKNGNIYPHLPIVTYENEGPPFKAPEPQTSVVQFNNENGLALNDSSTDLTALFEQSAAGSDEYFGCNDDMNTDSVPTLNIDKMTANSAYPDKYKQDLSSWLSDVAGQASSATDLASEVQHIPQATDTTAPLATATSTQPAPPAGSTAAVRTCDIDCGMQINPIHPGPCFCSCSDGQRWALEDTGPYDRECK